MDNLLSPLKIRNMKLKNRLALPPLASEKAGPGGRVTQGMIERYRELCGGGAVQLVIVEHSYVCPEGKASPAQLSIAEDGCVEGLSRLAGAIHDCGARALIQISHAGGVARREVTGLPSIAPSIVERPGKPIPEREMDEGEIHRVVDAFAAAAARAMRAGFDGVELHSAHGYLLNQFYSPLTNRRSDGYGGALEARIRIHGEAIAAARAAVGGGVLALRLGGCDYMEGGSSVEDAVQAARRFEEMGVDLLDISGGLCSYAVPGREGMQGTFADMSAAVRSAVKIPVLTAGGVTEAGAADELVRAGAADLIGVGRAMLRDAGWAARAIAQLSGR